MKDVGPATDDEVIAAWLAAEIESPRFQDLIVGDLVEPERSEVLAELRDAIHNPNLDDPVECEVRREILAGTRGFGVGLALFEGLPPVIDWRMASLTRGEVGRLRYANLGAWPQLAPQRRRAAEGASQILAGAHTVDSVHVNAVADALEDGNAFPPLIGLRDGTKLVLMEGHVRATAYALKPAVGPSRIGMYIGTCDGITDWVFR